MAGIPDEVGFATKGELAQQMLARAFAAEVPAEWVVGDTVYGYDELRLWLEAQQKNYVLAVSETHQVWVQGRPQPVGLLAALLPDEATSARARWVLIRRSLSERSERARLSRVWSGHDHLDRGRAGDRQSLEDRRGL
jgi:SRSO17 transposase